MDVSLTHLVPSSKTNRDHMIARLTDMVHSFSSTDRNTLTLFRKALKSLRNTGIVITKPDKENGVILLDRSDYFSKLEMIVKDRSKFMLLGPSNKYDTTEQVEMKLNKVLNELRDKSKIEE